MQSFATATSLSNAATARPSSLIIMLANGAGCGECPMLPAAEPASRLGVSNRHWPGDPHADLAPCVPTEPASLASAAAEVASRLCGIGVDDTATMISLLLRPLSAIRKTQTEPHQKSEGDAIGQRYSQYLGISLQTANAL
jgi:hypothetical protein